MLKRVLIKALRPMVLSTAMICTVAPPAFASCGTVAIESVVTSIEDYENTQEQEAAGACDIEKQRTDDARAEAIYLILIFMLVIPTLAFMPLIASSEANLNDSKRDRANNIFSQNRKLK